MKNYMFHKIKSTFFVNVLLVDVDEINVYLYRHIFKFINEQ